MAGMICMAEGLDSSHPAWVGRARFNTPRSAWLTVQILLMGGTRFVGKPLVSRLLHQGHQLTLFTRGRQPVPEGVEAER